MKKGNIKKIIVITAVVLIAAAIATVCACAGSASAGKNAAADKNLASDYSAPVVTKVSSDDNKDVYRVQFSDGGYFEFTVTNGREGKSAYELYAEQFGYEGGEKPCGKCGTCLDRIAAFEKNGLKDPLMEY